MKTLVITACSKEKQDRPLPARDLYTGQLFTLVKHYAEGHHFDWLIISAKHGLVRPNQVIAPYDATLQGMADVARVQDLVLPELKQIWGTYDRIIIIMGKQYRKVINPALKRQQPWARVPRQVVEIIEDERGIGGLKQRVKALS